MEGTKESRGIGSIIKIILIIAMVCFFFPLCTVSCGGSNMQVTGVEATFGMEVKADAFGMSTSVQQIEGNIVYGLLILIPAVLLICAFVIKEVQKSAIMNIVGAIIDVIILILLKTNITDLAAEYSASVKFEFGYYLQIILNVLIAVVSVFLIYYVSVNGIGSGYNSQIYSEGEGIADFKWPEREIKVESEEVLNRRGYIFLAGYCLLIVAIMGIIIYIV